MKIKKTEKPRRLTLKSWAALEDLRKQIDEKAKEGNWSAIPHLIFDSIELTIDGKMNIDTFWMDVAGLYNEALDINSPRKPFPILKSREKSKPLPWEYEGRSWYFWAHLLAGSYGWDLEEIGNLDLDDALGLFQEIEISEQLDREFYHGLSEVAYSYDKSTHKSRHIPLSRPDWMLPIAGKSVPVKKVKMRKDMLPVGNVISIDGQ